jgi:sortase A
VFHGPHFETRTESVGLLGIKKRQARRALLVTVVALVLILILGALDLPVYASGAYARFLVTAQERGSPTSDEGPAVDSGQVLPERSSAGNKHAGSSREDVRGKVAKLRRGELLLSVPRLGLRDVHVPSSSTQPELDKEGIIRLETSGLPSSEGSNTFIVGHRMGFPRTRTPYVFYELNKLRPQDEIIVEDPAGKKYVFEVYDHITGPPRLYWLTRPVPGKTIISLQTCTPIPSFENRLIVRGELIRVYSS